MELLIPLVGNFGSTKWNNSILLVLFLELHRHQHRVIVLFQAFGNSLEFSTQFTSFEGFDEAKASSNRYAEFASQPSKVRSS